jgi:hypothetical protein
MLGLLALGTAVALEVLAWIAVAEKCAERAGVLLGAAQRRWRHIGVSLDVLPDFSVLHSANEQVAMAFAVSFIGRLSSLDRAV